MVYGTGERNVVIRAVALQLIFNPYSLGDSRRIGAEREQLTLTMLTNKTNLDI